MPTVKQPVAVKMTPEEEMLVEKLKESAGRKSTPEERFQQKVSFVYGNTPARIDITREDVAKILRNSG